MNRNCEYIACFIPTVFELKPFLKYFKILSQIRWKQATYYAGHFKLEGAVGEKDVLLIQTGMGVNSAYEAARYAITSFQIREAWLFGFAGALQSELKVGHIVISEYLEMNGKKISGSEVLKSKLVSCFNVIGFKKYQLGTILTVKEIIRKKTQFLENSIQNQIVALAMEGYVVAEQMRDQKIPFLEVRWIFDELSEEIPDITDWFGADSQLIIRRALWSLLKKASLVLKLVKYSILNKKVLNEMEFFIKNFFINFF